MGKKKNKKTKTKTKTDTDMVDYLLDNVGSLSKNTSGILKHARDIWDVIPDVLSNILSGLMNIINKVTLKARAYAVKTMTNDIVRQEEDTQIWNKLREIYKTDKNVFANEIKKINNKQKNQRSKDICKLIKYYVRKNKKDNFVSFSMTQQNNEKFTAIRDNIRKISTETEKPIKQKKKNKTKTEKDLDKLLYELTVCSDESE